MAHIRHPYIIDEDKCPPGYAFDDGGVPNGDQTGQADPLKSQSMQHCADQCSDDSTCVSFGYNPGNDDCYLNKETDVLQGSKGDLRLCRKEGESQRGDECSSPNSPKNCKTEKCTAPNSPENCKMEYVSVPGYSIGEKGKELIRITNGRMVTKSTDVHGH